MPNGDPEGQILQSAPNNHDMFFFMHTFFLSQALDFNIAVAIKDSHSYTLTSAILKVDVVWDVAIMSTPIVLTPELRDLLHNQCIDSTCCYSLSIPQVG